MTQPGPTETGEAPILTVDAVDVRYGKSRALANVSLQVSKGETLAVLGANGAGKSSLARALSGVIAPAAGRIIFAGHDITSMPPQQIRRLGLSYIPEGRGIFRSLSVIDNLRVAVRWQGARKTRLEAIGRVCELFPILAERQNQIAGTLSGGEQQMLALAKGLAIWPRLLIADELSLGLAPRIVDNVFEQLAEARRGGVTIILIEQFVNRALAASEQIVVLAQGSVAWSGPSHGLSPRDVMPWYLGNKMNEPPQPGRLLTEDHE
jgi:branched-chain amino acid transport system ATP-binding protein